jgi:hypothetical protein
VTLSSRPDDEVPSAREALWERQREEQTWAGDLIVIHGHRVGESSRTAEILEVLGEPGHEHYRVRWEDDRETIYYPGGDATIQPAVRRRRTTGN